MNVVRRLPEKQTIADQAYNQLEKLLIMNQLSPGMLYTERELSETIGVGRTPLREALLRLANEGLVDILQRRGVQIPPVHHADQLKLLTVRRCLQNLAVECAIDNAEDGDCRAMETTGQRMIEEMGRTPCDREDYLALLRRSHELVGKASGNAYVTKTLGAVQGLSRRYWFHFAKERDFKLAAKYHSDMLFGIASHDKDAAMAASNALVDYLEDFARENMQP